MNAHLFKIVTIWPYQFFSTSVRSPIWTYN